MEQYRCIVRSALAAYQGREIDTAGDGFFAVFRDTRQAVIAAVRMQRAFATQAWARNVDFRVRMGIHTGDAIVAPTGFIGLEVHRASRICNAANGGQVLLTPTVLESAGEPLPEGADTIYLGEFLLKGFGQPERLFQLIVPGIDNPFLSPQTERPLPTIAVLPFAVRSMDPNDGFLGDGMAEEIIIALGKVPGLQVVARSASFAFRQQSLDPREIGKRLNADVILEGTVRRSSSRMRVNAELVDARSGLNLWSEGFEGKLEDIFVVQDDIARHIATALRLKLGSRQVRGIRSVQAHNVDAYRHYVQGRHLFYQFSRPSIEAALGLFQQAVAADASYALAYCGMANCYSYIYVYLDHAEENLQAAIQSSREAIELDPLLAEGYVAYGWVLSLTERLEEAEAAFDKAIDLDPKLFEARFLYGRVSFAQGKLEKAARLYEEANRRRPEDFQSLLLAGQVYDDLGEDVRSREMRWRGVLLAEKHLELNPHDTRALSLGANGLVALGERKKGLQWIEKALQLESDDAMLFYNAACIYALTDMPAKALDLLERSIEAGITHRDWLENDSNLDPLREEPRFKELIAGLLDPRS